MKIDKRNPTWSKMRDRPDLRLQERGGTGEEWRRGTGGARESRAWMGGSLSASPDGQGRSVKKRRSPGIPPAPWAQVV
eukprot:6166964-Pyramimonas_sp.AAC.1